MEGRAWKDAHLYQDLQMEVRISKSGLWGFSLRQIHSTMMYLGIF